MMINIYIYIGHFIIPTDDSSFIFQRGKYTTNQKSHWFMVKCSTGYPLKRDQKKFDSPVLLTLLGVKKM